MKNIRQIVALSIISGVALFSQACQTSASKSETEATQQPTKGPIATAFVLKKGGFSSSLKIPGELIPFQNVDLYAKVSSFVKKLYVDVGSEVRSGQLLAVMEAPEMNAQMAGAESRLKSQEAVYLSSKATYDRLLETSKVPGTVSPNELDIALAKQKSDLAQLESARAAQREIGDTRNYLEIRAPFAGVISARNVSAGAYVGPSGKGSELPMFTLVEQQKLRLIVSVPEAYISHLNNKSEVEFTVKSFPDKIYKAKVSRQSGALDNKLRAQRTEMDIINSDKKLIPGMVAEVLITLQENKDMFAVPSRAVLNAAEGLFVIKVVENKAVWVPVKIGKRDDKKTEVFGDLAEGDVILNTANEEIRNREEVKDVKIETL